MGHALGFEDLPAESSEGSLMSATLGTGVRHLVGLAPGPAISPDGEGLAANGGGWLGRMRAEGPDLERALGPVSARTGRIDTTRTAVGRTGVARGAQSPEAPTRCRSC
jgi:hypothetical protein